LRNLSINGAGTTLGLNGVNFTSGKAVHVEHCQIFNFSQNAISMNVNNTGGSLLHVEDTSIFNVNQGIRVNNSGTGFAVAVVDGTRISQITGSNASGVRLENNGAAELRDSQISFALNGTTANGVNVTTANGSVALINTKISRCLIGINIAAASTNRITHSQVILNGVGVQFAGGGILRSFGDNVYDQATNFQGGAISPQGQQ
jgi:hypothetical protein